MDKNDTGVIQNCSTYIYFYTILRQCKQVVFNLAENIFKHFPKVLNLKYPEFRVATNLGFAISA